MHSVGITKLLWWFIKNYLILPVNMITTVWDWFCVSMLTFQLRDATKFKIWTNPLSRVQVHAWVHQIWRGTLPLTRICDKHQAIKCKTRTNPLHRVQVRPWIQQIWLNAVTPPNTQINIKHVIRHFIHIIYINGTSAHIYIANTIIRAWSLDTRGGILAQVSTPLYFGACGVNASRLGALISRLVTFGLPGGVRLSPFSGHAAARCPGLRQR